MSTHSRLACALVALGIAAPATGALAATDTGGSAYSADAKPHPKKVRALGDRVPVRRGMKGRDVRDLQGNLRRLGYAVAVDGAFGRGTLRAYRAFERRARLTVDGVVGSADIARLRRILARGGFPPPPAPAERPAGSRARVGKSGLAAAPADAPPAVKAIIAAGNRIATKPYRYGGGHGRWKDSGYDCSGSVSYALHGAGLLEQSMASGGFTTWGRRGYGKWVTIFANGGHMYMVVAGLRFDTSGLSGAGSRWQTAKRPTRGYSIRHPAGL